MLQDLLSHHQAAAAGRTADAVCTADAKYLTADGRVAIRADALITADSARVTADGYVPCGDVTPVVPPSVVEVYGGGGKVRRNAKDYDFLDPEYWKRLDVPEPVIKTITKVARKVAQKVPKAASNGEADRYLIERLKQEQIAWDKFYSQLLKEQIDRAITIEIQAKLIEAGLINAEQARLAQEQDDEERAILELLMEM